MSLNCVQLVGNLTRDPEMRHTQTGTAVCNMGLAINEKRGQNEHTVFVDMTAFGHTAEFCGKWLAKGKQVAVIGRLKFEQWNDQNGNKRSKLTVIAEKVNFLSGGEGGGQQGQGRQQQGGYNRQQQPQGGYNRGGDQQGGYDSYAQSLPPDDDMPY